MEGFEAPNTLYLYCSRCDDETLHHVLKAKTGQKKMITIDSTVQCEQCHQISHHVIRSEKPLTIPVIISKHNLSERSMIECYPDETLLLGQEFFLGDTNYMITAIESGPRRVEKARADEIDTLWVKQYDWVRVHISVNLGPRTVTRDLSARPEEEFAIGDVLRLKGLKVAVHRIKTKERIIRKGAAEAREIVRVYGKAIR